MGVAFTCGLEKVVLPSFKLGMPVEYELIRSIATVSGDQRRKLGVVKTDAEMMGGFSFAGGQPRQIPKQLILEDLERQYKVEEVDPANPIEVGRYDMAKGAAAAFNPDEPVVSHFEEVLFPFPTGITQKTGAKTKMTELVRTADKLSGTIDVDKLEADRMDERLLQRDRGRPSPR